MAAASAATTMIWLRRWSLGRAPPSRPRAKGPPQQHQGVPGTPCQPSPLAPLPHQRRNPGGGTTLPWLRDVADEAVEAAAEALLTLAGPDGSPSPAGWQPGTGSTASPDGLESCAAGSASRPTAVASFAVRAAAAANSAFPPQLTHQAGRAAAGGKGGSTRGGTRW
jgi:hypothetical protein